MIKITDKSQCCGCTACANVCRYEAITMISDNKGFLYPQVNLEKCIGCGLCDKVCQFTDHYDRYDNYDEPQAYSFRINDSAQLMRSQSGGAFYSVAKFIIQNGGVVYGAAFNSCWRVVHKRVSSLNELECLRKSKYVQSDIRGVLLSVKDDLNNGKEVLFSGTSCQVAGLRAYIPRGLCDKLTCIDIICHGVPSPKLWEDYLKYLKLKYKSDLLEIQFRDKRFGWHGAKESYLFRNGEQVVRKTSNYLYFQGFTIRESCASCVFANTKRVGDISVGDLWGLPKDSKYELDSKGVSLVLVNSNQGKVIFDRVKALCDVERVDFKMFLQPQLQHPCVMNPRRDAFWTDYHNKGFVYVAKRYGDIGLRYKRFVFKKKIKEIFGR